MNNLLDREPKLRIFSLRAALLKVNRDLLGIDSQVRATFVRFSDRLTLAEELVLILEDRRFFEHLGVDWRSGLREIFRAVTFRRHGGASTIDMQFVRTVTGYRDKTLRRKLYEIFLATLIQRRYNKITILRSYLDCAFFGSHIEGIGPAAKKLFGKPARQLNVDEASFIAAMLVYPRPRKETDSWRLKVQRRADYGKRIYSGDKERFKQLPR